MALLNIDADLAFQVQAKMWESGFDFSEATKKQFDKRHSFYQYLVQRGNRNKEELLEIQKKMRDITGAKSQVTQNIKQAVFVGSNSDFIKSIKEKQKTQDNG